MSTFTRISIHALRVESDICTGSCAVIPYTISIHALRVESDKKKGARLWTRQRFLSTLSVWRATRRTYRTAGEAPYFYPRSPCGERPFPRRGLRQSALYFYPRSPCGERQHDCANRTNHGKFLSTLSVWRATSEAKNDATVLTISIHALRVESDRAFSIVTRIAVLFLSTLSVWRATARTQMIKAAANQFLSTLSVWRATCDLTVARTQ